MLHCKKCLKFFPSMHMPAKLSHERHCTGTAAPLEDSPRATPDGLVGPPAADAWADEAEADEEDTPAAGKWRKDGCRKLAGSFLGCG